MYLIKDIPMDDKQDYDVLGFIYEYLISNFAANAGKKAGEFYTPHEVSLLMSEIIAEHLKYRTEIKIYDPCSGSGSLLINIGKSVSKHMDSKDNIKYYVVKQKALPEVLLKVAEANRLIENKNISIADATEKVGISRSSYYKYKDDIFPFRDNSKGKTITFVLSMEDEPGLLSVVLKKVAEFKANILTIHQTIPVNGIASLTLSVEILPTTGDASMMIEEIEQLNGVRYLKILSSDASL